MRGNGQQRDLGNIFVVGVIGGKKLWEKGCKRVRFGLNSKDKPLPLPTCNQSLIMFKKCRV
jgi:hypothetical protein